MVRGTVDDMGRHKPKFELARSGPNWIDSSTGAGAGGFEHLAQGPAGRTASALSARHEGRILWRGQSAIHCECLTDYKRCARPQSQATAADLLWSARSADLSRFRSWSQFLLANMAAFFGVSIVVRTHGIDAVAPRGISRR
jgi:hypothetical protein